MSWYKFSNFLEDLMFKLGDQVYTVDPESKKIDEYGIIYDSDVEEGIVYGWWGTNPKEVVKKYKSEDSRDNIEKRKLSTIAVGRFPINFLMHLIEDEKLSDYLKKFNFIPKQLESIFNHNSLPESKAQSLYNLDLPIPDDLSGVNTERIWMYDNNAANLWWGEGKYKWDEGKEDIIQGLPRYNPEYNADEVGAYFTWEEPYIEPVMYDDLINVQRSMNAYFYPGKYNQSPSSHGHM